MRDRIHARGENWWDVAAHGWRENLCISACQVFLSKKQSMQDGLQALIENGSSIMCFPSHFFTYRTSTEKFDYLHHGLCWICMSYTYIVLSHSGFCNQVKFSQWVFQIPKQQMKSPLVHKVEYRILKNFSNLWLKDFYFSYLIIVLKIVLIFSVIVVSIQVICTALPLGSDRLYPQL